MSTSLRILAFNWRCLRHSQAGGAELNLFEQARHWVKNGHAVTIVTAASGGTHASASEEVIDGIQIYRRGGRFSVYLFAALFALRYAHQFDCILDVANGIPFFTPLLSKTPGVLLVHHVHDRQWFSEFPKPIAMVGRFIERKVVPLLYARRRVIAVSPTTRDALIEIGFVPEQIEVVYNGVQQPMDAQPIPANTSYHIAYVGRMKRYKRIDLLVRVIAKLRSEFPDIHLDLAGDGDALPQLEALIKELKLQEHVTVHGFVDEQTKTALLRSATVFATPSMHEGWGLSVIEANTYGCPAVAYNVPGLSVSIRHGETGLLASDDNDFCRALASILRSPALRAQLGAGARNWASKFSWKSTAAATLEILQAGGKRPSTYNTASEGLSIPHGYS